MNPVAVMGWAGLGWAGLGWAGEPLWDIMGVLKGNRWSRAQPNAKVSKSQAVQPLALALRQEPPYISLSQWTGLFPKKKKLSAAVITMPYVDSLT